MNDILNIRILLSIFKSARMFRLIYLSSLLLLSFTLLALAFLSQTPQAKASTPRIKDIVTFEGIRENLLVGYGLVVGLNGTGDRLTNSVFTEKSLQSFLSKLGVGTVNEQLRVRNVAAVTVTARLPAFARAGSKIDITVSALGDARSLEGGMLIATPLMGADGETYAVAQGQISIGGFSAEGDENSVTKGVPTSGFVVQGAIVEREIPFELNELDEIKLSLRNPDLTTAKTIEKKVNEKLGDSYARATDPSTVSIMVPFEYARSVASLLAEIEQLNVSTDQVAKIIIDEASGTIVMNKNVKIDTVAVAQGNLVVSISQSESVSQPAPFAPESADTLLLEGEALVVEEEEGNIAYLEQNATLKDLVNGLNSLGVSTRDLITILQTIKSAGAMHAEIQTR